MYIKNVTVPLSYPTDLVTGPVLFPLTRIF